MARDLASQAKLAFLAHDYAHARDLFHRAYTLVPAPTIAVYEARALVKLGKLVAAEEAYMRAVRTSLDAGSPEQFRKASRDAEAELLALRPRIPRLTIHVTGAGREHPSLSVLLDGTELSGVALGVGVPVDPGDHELHASVSGAAGESVKVRLAEGQQIDVEVVAPAPEPAAEAPVAPSVTPPRTAPPSRAPGRAAIARSAAPTQKTWAFVAGGIGIAGLGTGVVTGLLATSKYAEAKDSCPNRVCVEGSGGADALASFRTLRTVSTVGYVVGGLGLVGFGVLYFTAPSTNPDAGPTVSLWVAPAGGGVAGKF
ncbi:MAG TPA: hypothetical protein VHE30_02580 [Polyangiaceae bacterium]|nr:hypothetical protein [Polyangiaceae bacterium]